MAAASTIPCGPKRPPSASAAGLQPGLPDCYCFDMAADRDITVTRGTPRALDRLHAAGNSRKWRGARSSGRAGGSPATTGCSGNSSTSAEATGQPWCVGCGRLARHTAGGHQHRAIVNRLVGTSDGPSRLGIAEQAPESRPAARRLVDRCERDGYEPQGIGDARRPQGSLPADRWPTIKDVRKLSPSRRSTPSPARRAELGHRPGSSSPLRCSAWAKRPFSISSSPHRAASSSWAIRSVRHADAGHGGLGPDRSSDPRPFGTDRRREVPRARTS